MTNSLRPAAVLLATAATGLALAGCKVDNRPLLARGQPAADAYASGLPAPGPLDPADAAGGYAQPAAYLPPQEAYAYPARAYRVSRSYYDAPPAYAFAYGDEQPWVWGAADEDMMVAEPYDGGYRYYYYEPGDDYPYFVQDADYGYAYDDTGALIALFDAAGAVVSNDRYGGYDRRAHSDWSRGYALDRAGRVSPHYGVQPTVWRQQAPVLASGHERWFQAAADHPAWRAAVARGAVALPYSQGPRPGGSRNQTAAARVAQAAPAPAAVRGAATPQPQAQAWRQARQDHGAPAAAHVQGAQSGRAHAAARPAFARAAPQRGLAHAGPAAARPVLAQAAPRPGGGNGAAQIPHGRGHPAFAQSVQQHVQSAAFHAPAPPRGGGHPNAGAHPKAGGRKPAAANDHKEH